MNNINLEKLPLEAIHGKMELGKAYVDFRGDDSMMVYRLHEMYDSKWFAESWFDLYRYAFRMETHVSCLNRPLFVEEFEKNKTETISGLYLIDDSTYHTIENAVCKIFNTVAPCIDEIEQNIIGFDYNEWHFEQPKENKKGVVCDNK